LEREPKKDIDRIMPDERHLIDAFNGRPKLTAIQGGRA
jgi:hypothetical protein